MVASCTGLSSPSWLLRLWVCWIRTAAVRLDPIVAFRSE